MAAEAHTSHAREAAPSDLLRIYLNDHLVGAVAGSRRARRTARAEANSSDGSALATVAAEIAEDLHTLRSLMGALGVRPRGSRVALGWAVERAGLLKLNGRLFRRSPLSTLLEIEALRIGVEGKRMLWQTLGTYVDQGQIRGVDLDELSERASKQAGILADLHHHAVAGAIGVRPFDPAH
jgi:hypothetical protein